MYQNIFLGNILFFFGIEKNLKCGNFAFDVSEVG
jgi:hypothetical protein